LVGVKEYDVLGVFNANKPKIKATNINYVQADLRNLKECKAVVKGANRICMFAGQLSTTAVMLKNPLGPITDNTVINVNMLEAAYSANVEKYLWLSSTTGYPSQEKPLVEDDYFKSEPPPPYEPVGWMSRFIEKLSMLYATKTDNSMSVACLRPTAVYGEHDDFNYETCHALPALTRRVAERHQSIEIWGSGEDERDWLYIDDLIDACLLALEKFDGYNVVNAGSGKSYSLNQLLNYLLEIENYSEAEILHNKKDENTITLKRSFDCTMAKNLMGFKAKTNIIEGLSKTLYWYKNNH